jgi:ADP-ribose pyrophosphatase YjhB (NUDIX family)
VSTPQPGITRIAAYGVARDGEGRFLLCRLSAVTTLPGTWTLPGGGIDFGEHPEAAVVREIEEETGLRGRVLELLLVDSWSGSIARVDESAVPYHAVRIVYRVAVEPGDIRFEVGGSTDAARWFTPEELVEVDVRPYARAAVEQVLRTERE